jgi:TonB family protein
VLDCFPNGDDVTMKAFAILMCFLIGIPAFAINLGLSQRPSTPGLIKGDLTLTFPVEIKGDEFRQYKIDVTQDVQDKSYNLNAETVRLSLAHKGKIGKVVIDFSILREGAVADVRLVESSGDKKLDKAAVEAITASSPHAALPPGFKGDKLDVRFEYSFKP